MKIAMLFPGYGDQYVGMARDMYNTSDTVRKFFTEAQEHLNIDFAQLCFENQKILPGLASEDKLDMIDKAYMAIYVVSCAINALLKEHEIKPAFVAGYDTGTYAAIHAAGGINYVEGLYLLRNFARLYISMLKTHEQKFDIIKVCGLTETKLTEFLDHRISIAAYQSRTQHLISGTQEGIQDLREKLRKASKVTLYDMGVGLSLNSDVMLPVAEQLRLLLKQLSIHTLKVPLISSINAQLVQEEDLVKEEMVAIIDKPIRWDRVVDCLAPVDLVLGMGPAATIMRLVNEQYPEKKIITIKTMEDIGSAQQFINKK